MTSHPTTSELAVEVVDSMEQVSGTYPGYRRAHARGACFDATFTPSGDAAALTTAAHLQRTPVPATVRFSNSNGSPHTLDGARAGRGIAVKFRLPDGSATDLVAVNLPVFLASTPENFLNLLGALKKDPVTGVTDPARVGAYIQNNPEAAAGFQAAATMPIPVSYGTARYWAIHAFEWTDAEGRSRFVRYRWEPDLGLHELSEEDGAVLPEEYLTEELVRRLENGPVGFTLHVQLAEPGDPTNDATKAWPADREEIVAGRLEITAPVADQAHWAAEIFDPTRVTKGIALSDDPILAFRNQAYAVSYSRRTHNA
ncbi:catalase family peroxidase [Allokutzneria oryzae]|uniref:Catalase-related peroxidase n=1 Tax=Allokutzneria oryzae TaxID=1378989 RepID=A0ABV5ZY63_9PSEU